MRKRESLRQLQFRFRRKWRRGGGGLTAGKGCGFSARDGDKDPFHLSPTWPLTSYPHAGLLAALHAPAEQRSEGFFKCRGGRGGGAKNVNIHIPDTVVFKSGRPYAWYFTSRNGELQRKNSWNLDENSIMERFTAGAAALSDDDHHGIVAILIRREQQRAEPPSEEVEGGDGGDAVTTIAHLDRAALSDLLYSVCGKEDGGCAVPDNSLLQRFVEPRGERNTVIQARWSPHTCIVELCANVNRIGDETLGTLERMVTFEGPDHLRAVSAALPWLQLRVRNACSELARRASTTTSAQPGCGDIARLTLYLKQGADGSLSLLWCGHCTVFDHQGGHRGGDGGGGGWLRYRQGEVDVAGAHVDEKVVPPAGTTVVVPAANDNPAPPPSSSGRVAPAPSANGDSGRARAVPFFKRSGGRFVCGQCGDVDTTNGHTFLVPFKLAIECHDAESHDSQTKTVHAGSAAKAAQYTPFKIPDGGWNIGLLTHTTDSDALTEADVEYLHKHIGGAPAESRATIDRLHNDDNCSPTCDASALREEGRPTKTQPPESALKKSGDGDDENVPPPAGGLRFEAKDAGIPPLITRLFPNMSQARYESLKMNPDFRYEMARVCGDCADKFSRQCEQRQPTIEVAAAQRTTANHNRRRENWQSPEQWQRQVDANSGRHSRARTVAGVQIIEHAPKRTRRPYPSSNVTGGGRKCWVPPCARPSSGPTTAAGGGTPRQERNQQKPRPKTAGPTIRCSWNDGGSTAAPAPRKIRYCPKAPTRPRRTQSARRPSAQRMMHVGGGGGSSSQRPATATNAPAQSPQLLSGSQKVSRLHQIYLQPTADVGDGTFFDSNNRAANAKRTANDCGENDAQEDSGAENAAEPRPASQTTPPEEMETHAQEEVLASVRGKDNNNTMRPSSPHRRRIGAPNWMKSVRSWQRDFRPPTGSVVDDGGGLMSLRATIAGPAGVHVGVRIIEELTKRMQLLFVGLLQRVGVDNGARAHERNLLDACATVDKDTRPTDDKLNATRAHARAVSEIRHALDVLQELESFNPLLLEQLSNWIASCAPVDTSHLESALAEYHGQVRQFRRRLITGGGGGGGGGGGAQLPQTHNGHPSVVLTHEYIRSQETRQLIWHKSSTATTESAAAQPVVASTALKWEAVVLSLVGDLTQSLQTRILGLFRRALSMRVLSNEDIAEGLGQMRRYVHDEQFLPLAQWLRCNLQSSFGHDLSRAGQFEIALMIMRTYYPFEIAALPFTE